MNQARPISAVPAECPCSSGTLPPLAWEYISHSHLQEKKVEDNNNNNFYTAQFYVVETLNALSTYYMHSPSCSHLLPFLPPPAPPPPPPPPPPRTLFSVPGHTLTPPPLPCTHRMTN